MSSKLTIDIDVINTELCKVCPDLDIEAVRLYIRDETKAIRYYCRNLETCKRIKERFGGYHE